MMKKLAITDLAERLPQPVALAKLQRELDDLRDRRDAAAAELEAIETAIPPGGAYLSGPAKGRRDELRKTLAEMNAAIVDKRKRHAEIQDQHLAKVSARLAPLVSEQKAAVGAAFAAFLSEVAAIDTFDVALKQAAGHDTGHLRSSALSIGLAVRHVLGGMIGAELVDAALKLHAPPKRRAA